MSPILFPNLQVKTNTVFQIKVVTLFWRYTSTFFFFFSSRALLSLSRTPETQVVVSEFTLVTRIICMYRQKLNTYEAAAQANQVQEEQAHSLNSLPHLLTMETQDQRAGHRVNLGVLIV